MISVAQQIKNHPSSTTHSPRFSLFNVHYRRSRSSHGINNALIILVIFLIALLIYQTFKDTSPSPNHKVYVTWKQESSSTHRHHKTHRRTLEPRQRIFPAKHLKTLVLVACHSVYTGLDFSHPEDQSSWLLLDYQKVPGQTHSFIEHIKLGIQHAASDPHAMLLFSGGKTRKDAGPRAESMGYWLVSEANDWFGYKNSVRQRAFTEEHARDSFENILFGLCRFYELTGHYPQSIVAVGYEFKKERFVSLHRAALRWPEHRFSYIGTPALQPDAEKGEASTVALFREDPYGCGPELLAKRRTRDPFAEGGYAGERCPDMSGLLEYCGIETYANPLPWAGLSRK